MVSSYSETTLIMYIRKKINESEKVNADRNAGCSSYP